VAVGSFDSDQTARRPADSPYAAAGVVRSVAPGIKPTRRSQPQGYRIMRTATPFAFVVRCQPAAVLQPAAAGPRSRRLAGARRFPQRRSEIRQRRSGGGQRRHHVHLRRHLHDDPNWGVELLAALPFEHDIALVDGPDGGSTKHLPPTLSVVYHFLPEAPFSPTSASGSTSPVLRRRHPRPAGRQQPVAGYVGGPLPWSASTSLGSNWFLNADVRYLDIETDAKLDGVASGKRGDRPLGVRSEPGLSILRSVRP
jgi:hypothetical protein